MDTGPLSITRPLALDLIDETGAATSVRADLTYDAADPYAVTAGFSMSPGLGGNGETVRWVFARELLVTGVHQPVGEGDVRIWPCLNALGQAITVIELSAPDGEALLQARSVEMCAFLQETEVVVPSGTEAMHVDVDDAVSKLLGDPLP